MAEADDPGFLARWSRRKHASRQARDEALPEPELEAGPVIDIPAETAEPAPEPRSAPRDATELPALPDIASLDAGSDFKPFLRPGVPPELKRAALRRLWRVNPIINSLDGLDDYYVTHDFTDAATVVPDLKTVYQVGRGMIDVIDKLTADRPEDERARIGSDARPAIEEPAATAEPDRSPVARTSAPPRSEGNESS
jgi:hypothetical protein